MPSAVETRYSCALAESVNQAASSVTTTSLMNVGAVVKLYDAWTSPLAGSTTRPVPVGPPATQSSPSWAWRPTDGVPGPSLTTDPSPVRRSMP